MSLSSVMVVIGHISTPSPIRWKMHCVFLCVFLMVQAIHLAFRGIFDRHHPTYHLPPLKGTRLTVLDLTAVQSQVAVHREARPVSRINVRSAAFRLQLTLLRMVGQGSNKGCTPAIADIWGRGGGGAQDGLSKFLFISFNPS